MSPERNNNDPIEILIVDDREDGLLALEVVLGDNTDYHIIKARSGLEALEKVAERNFAVILLDVQMPQMDGMQTAERIRKLPGYESTPIIFVTAINHDERYVYRGYEVGAVDYIFKPFDPIILRSKVAIFVDLHRKNKQLFEQSIRLREAENLERMAFIQGLELQSLKRYQNLADSIPHMVLRTTPEGELEYTNRVWVDYTGHHHSESLGQGWQAVIHPDDFPRMFTAWTQCLKSGESLILEGRIRRHDGDYRWHLIKTEPEKDNEGNVIAWLGTCTDIHDRKNFENQLQEARRNAEAASEAKTHFLANMSHEIRTPLNAVMGFSSLLLDPDLGLADKAKSVGIVQRNCQQLLKIIDDLLDLSKVEVGELTIEKIEVPVLELVADVKHVMETQAQKKDVQFKFDLESGIPAKVLTDFTRLRQILLNVIGNAIKFTSHGSVSVVAKFRKEDERDMLEFRVTDSGIGVDVKNTEKIFLPFSQADNSTTRLFGGTGLGLALSRRLARALGGDVRLVSSEPGVGSSFLIEVEVQVPSDSGWLTRARETKEKTANEIAVKAPQSVLKGRRILLVEDAEDNQVLIEFFLSQTGAIVEIAKNGQEAIDMALTRNYEVVLMDIQMPLVDGYQATRRLRGAGYTTPIIALTAHALAEEVEKCMETGCSGHLTKPIDRNLLIDSLIRYMN